jgi:type I restriction enzyme M protein
MKAKNLQFNKDLINRFQIEDFLMEENYRKISNTIWNIANHLRGSWKAHEYQDVILPLTVLKRLDAALEPTKQKVLEKFNELDGKVHNLRILRRASGYDFYNISPFTFKKLLEDPAHIARNLRRYIDGFSDNVKEIIEKFDFEKQLERLEGSNILYLVLQEFEKVDLHPDRVPNHVIGLAFEDLIRRFAEQSNETAGEHYTPRDVVRLMTALIFAGEEKELSKPGIVKLLYDPACGTGGMLTTGKDYIQTQFNKDAKIHLFGQELNAATYAICKADMLLKGENADDIKGGDREHDKASTLSNDQHADKKFDYVICNPPYGVEWKKDQEVVEREHERGSAGRFGAGLPRISDGQLLFLQHIVSKFKPRSEGGSVAGVIFNGSPLFTGNAGSGESEIRRWIMENDFDKAIVALPDQLFFNTGIATYIWILSNRKSADRRDKIQLIDARSFRHTLRKNMGHKRYEISTEDIGRILTIYRDFKVSKYSKIFNVSEFGYREITIQRPLRLRFEVDEKSLLLLKGLLDVTEFEIVRTLKGKVFMDRPNFLAKLKKESDHLELVFQKRKLNAIINTIGKRDERAEVCLDGAGNSEPDNELKDYERVPLGESIDKYFTREVKPYVPDAWIDTSICDEKDGRVGIVGYEIPFTKYFYKYEHPRELSDIEQEIKSGEVEIRDLLKKSGI